MPRLLESRHALVRAEVFTTDVGIGEAPDKLFPVELCDRSDDRFPVEPPVNVRKVGVSLGPSLGRSRTVDSRQFA